MFIILTPCESLRGALWCALCLFVAFLLTHPLLNAMFQWMRNTLSSARIWIILEKLYTSKKKKKRVVTAGAREGLETVRTAAVLTYMSTSRRRLVIFLMSDADRTIRSTNLLVKADHAHAGTSFLGGTRSSRALPCIRSHVRCLAGRWRRRQCLGRWDAVVTARWS